MQDGEGLGDGLGDRVGGGGGRRLGERRGVGSGFGVNVRVVAGWGAVTITVAAGAGWMPFARSCASSCLIRPVRLSTLRVSMSMRRDASIRAFRCAVIASCARSLEPTIEMTTATAMPAKPIAPKVR